MTDATPQKDTQSRKYLLTINNPHDKGITHDTIKAAIKEQFSTIQYYCMSDEVGGKDKTHHTHIFLMFTSPVRFSQVKKHFPSAHIDRCRGSAQDNRDYVFKEGKHADSDKAATNLKETHYESGELPNEPGRGARTDLAAIHAMIREGATTEEIVEEHPNQVLNVSRIEQARQLHLHSQSKKTIRDIFVIYVHGGSGTGKTRTVMSMNDLTDVYRVTGYKHPFDAYSGEKVLVLDEFRSSLEISQLLNILDIYPTALEARYTNRQAAYTRVYIISNDSINSQYPGVKNEKPETWTAFRRRVHLVIDYNVIAAQTNDYEERTRIFKRLVETALKSNDPQSMPHQIVMDGFEDVAPQEQEIEPNHIVPENEPDYWTYEELEGLTEDDYAGVEYLPS